MALRLTCCVFADGAAIPRRHTCEGEDVSPPSEWTGVPAETRSLALLCDDPDAPGTKEGINEFGPSGYSGPCPPPGHGVHHHRFRLLALDVVTLAIDDSPANHAVEASMRERVLAEAIVFGTYECARQPAEACRPRP